MKDRLKTAALIALFIITAAVVMTGMWYEGYRKGNVEAQTSSVIYTKPVEVDSNRNYIHGEYGGGDRINDWKNEDY